MISNPVQPARSNRKQDAVVRRRVAHRRVLGLCVPGLAGFDGPGVTCVAVTGVEQAMELLTALDFDLMLVGGECLGPAVMQLNHWMRAMSHSPRWAVVSDEPHYEIQARALGAVAVIPNVYDPLMMRLLEGLE